MHAAQAGEPAAHDEIAVTRTFRLREKTRCGGLQVEEIEPEFQTLTF
jgi:hypothetical protein